MVPEFSFIRVADPAQYSRLIAFTPAANKPGELHRIKIWVIEIGSCLTKHNSSLAIIFRFWNDFIKQKKYMLLQHTRHSTPALFLYACGK